MDAVTDELPSQLDVRLSNPQLGAEQKPLAFADYLTIDLTAEQQATLAAELLRLARG